jgi:repressor LexA
MVRQMDNINVIIGQNIKRYRKLRQWTLEELAEKSGYTSDSKRSSMSRIESGKNDIPISRLLAIANALDVGVMDLIDDQSTQTDDNPICNLLSTCYHKDAYHIVRKFLHLDAADQIRIAERIDMLIENPKYDKKRKSDIAT